MNAKKCKQLRRVAREQAADAPYREYQIAPKQRFISLTPTCARGLYQHYKKLYRKHQQMPVLKAEADAIDAALEVA